MRERIEETDIRLTLMTDTERWPLLVRAAENMQAAHSTKIEWLIDRIERCECCGQPRTRRHAEHNFTQIFRTPFDPEKVNEREALEQHLDDIETALRDGRREYDFDRCVSLMGGVIDLLGHWPRKRDYLALKILRSTSLLRDRGLLGAPTTHEWLTELSLIARTGGR